MNDTSNLILRENWIVLPSIYLNLAVNLAHAGHLGMTKTKALWTKLSTQLLGYSVLKFLLPHPITSLHRFISQSKPSEILDTSNLDFLGPFLNAQYISVMIDQRTKYSDVEFMRDTSARNVILR